MECLVVVREPKLQRVLVGLLGGLGVQPRLSPSPEHALNAVRDNRYDAVVVDCCDFADGPQIIRTMRKLPSNGRAIAFAILPHDANSQTRTATEAHFVLQQPLSVDLMTRSLRAARNLMLQEQRRFFRYAVELPVNLAGGGDEYRANSTNVSAGGMAIKPIQSLEPAWTGKIRFDLPERAGTIEAKAEVAWMLPDHTAGLRFTQMADKTRALLEQWISARVVEDDPLSSDKKA